MLNDYQERKERVKTLVKRQVNDQTLVTSLFQDPERGRGRRGRKQKDQVSAGHQMGGVDEKDGITKYKLVVIKQSWRCTA